MSATETVVCTCGGIGADPNTVRLSACHHRYWKGDKELVSVSKILRSTWPIPPDFSKADPAVLENARDRGIVVDALFSACVNGTLTHIPAGTRMDALDLFFKLMRWWDGRPKEEKPAVSQVILHDDEVAGTCDLRTLNGIVLDVKATYNIEAHYRLQLGGYADLYESMFGALPMIGIIHVTERFPEPKLIPLNAAQCRDDWRILRRMHGMVQRVTNGKL